MLNYELYVGKHYTELPDPCLIVDLDALDHNIGLMQDFVDETGLVLRPHIKTHKCPAIANLQIKAGAVGVTCAKLGEAQAMALNGISDILIANEIVTEPKIKSLACLNRYASVIVCADNKDNIDDLDHWAGYFGVKIPVLVELNIALDRCGARNADEVLELAKHVMNKNNLDLKGIQAYEGRYPDEICTGADMTAWTEKVTGHVAEVRKYLEDAGITCDIVSGIGTSTLTHAVKIPDALTEVQTGSYVFMESAYDIEKVGLSLEQSLFIMTKVCSIHGDRIILAAGEKSITNDQGMPVIKDDPDAQFEMNEEHILLDKTEKLKDLKIGDTVLIIPSHCCTTVNLHDYLFGVRNGIVESVWPVTARGCSF